jgi:hypothetical protein
VKEICNCISISKYRKEEINDNEVDPLCRYIPGNQTKIPQNIFYNDQSLMEWYS